MADTFALLPLLRRWWWALTLGALLAGVAAYMVSSRASPTYEGETKLIVGPINGDPSDLDASGSLARTYSELAVGRPVLQQAIERVGARLTVRELQDNLTVSANDVSRILTIGVRDGSETVATGLANAIGVRLQELSKLDPAQTARRVNAFIEESAIESLSQKERESVESAARRLFADSSAGRITVVQPAVREGPADRRTPFVVILAMLAGAVIAAVVALVRESTGEGIDDESTLEELTGVRHLGRVDAPRGRGWRQSLPAWTAPGTPAAEKYRLLAFKIGLLDTSDPPGSLVLLDPGEGRASGAVAINLAAAISEARLRVIVVDANTTGEGLTRMLRLEGASGYTDVLAEPVHGVLERHIQRVFLGGGGYPLAVMALGQPRAVATLDVDSVRRLLERLQTIADVVVVSAPPPHRAPAGLMWARVADKTLVAVDERRTSRDDVKDTLQGLSAADATVVGTTLAQRRPLAEFLGGLRGASGTPPRRLDADGRSLAPLEPSSKRWTR